MTLVDLLFSNITSNRTYSKFIYHLGRRETFNETINRLMSMHLDQFPKLSKDIIKAFQRVHDYKVMPSMRALQFAGDAILKNHARQYNCSYAPIDDTKVFSEALFLLLSGVGFGYSVQSHHVNKLPKIQLPRESGYYCIHDSIQGWAEALNVLIEAYFYGKIRPEFDFGNIRPKGSYLVTTGAKAPGPEPLKAMLKSVEEHLKASVGRKLRPIEAHDIVCISSDAVLAGGIRRAALISLFDKDDNEMLKSKHGSWWEKYPYRARANNSAVLERSTTTYEEFAHIFKMCQESGSGEPGFYWTNNLDWGCNPCVIGETKILTKDGYKTIESLIEQEVEIWNGFEWSMVVPKVTGENQDIYTVTFSDGRTLTCTGYHNFHTAVGYTGKTEIVQTKDLEPGMKLIKHKFPIIEHGEDYKYAYQQGFISAEGMDGYNYVWVYEPKYMCITRLQGKLGSEYKGRRTVRFSHELLPKSFVPFNWNLKSKLDWLSGLFDGDGTELKEGGLQLVSVDKNFLSQLQELISTLGIQCKIVPSSKAGMRSMPDGHGGYKDFYCQDAYRICIGAVQMQDLKRLGLSCERMSFNKTPQRDASQFITVVDITEAGTADKVYCFNEPKNHTGIFNGIITGQCCEIALQPNQFCNLTTINQSNVADKRDFMNRVYAATLIGTLQASYTDFQYLRPVWQQTTESEALLGVSFTGIADGNGIVTNEWLKDGALFAQEVNDKYAKKIGINSAARVTAVKPEGSASCVLASSSGIHARHARHYIRRIRMNKDDALAVYLKAVIPELVEDDVMSTTGVVVSIPQSSPSNSITRHDETALSLFERTINYNQQWVRNGHRTGDNTHNVSVTISVKSNEWDSLREKMWEYRELYNGISLLPFDGANYQQMPFEDCTEETFDKMSLLVKDIDLTKVKEETDTTNRLEILACAGGSCEIV